MALYDIGKKDKAGNPILLNWDGLSFAEWCAEAGIIRHTRADYEAWKRNISAREYKPLIP